MVSVLGFERKEVREAPLSLWAARTGLKYYLRSAQVAAPSRRSRSFHLWYWMAEKHSRVGFSQPRVTITYPIWLPSSNFQTCWNSNISPSNACFTASVVNSVWFHSTNAVFVQYDLQLGDGLMASKHHSVDITRLSLKVKRLLWNFSRRKH